MPLLSTVTVPPVVAIQMAVKSPPMSAMPAADTSNRSEVAAAPSPSPILAAPVLGARKRAAAIDAAAD